MDIEKIIQDPSAIFAHPQEVVDSAELTLKEKIQILESWAYDIEELEKAEEENMGGNANYHLLREIKNMVLELK